MKKILTTIALTAGLTAAFASNPPAPVSCKAVWHGQGRGKILLNRYGKNDFQVAQVKYLPNVDEKIRPGFFDYTSYPNKRDITFAMNNSANKANTWHVWMLNTRSGKMTFKNVHVKAGHAFDMPSVEKMRHARPLLGIFKVKCS